MVALCYAGFSLARSAALRAGLRREEGRFSASFPAVETAG
jgi:hypothetical protein